MIVLGLGSNMGDRLGFLRAAKQELGAFVRNIQCSPIYESPAMLPENAPPEWDRAFYNMAIRGETILSPFELLDAVKAIEQKLKREIRGHWGPREIDIDILAYGDMLISMPGLDIPHRGLVERDFALIPFADIAPEWKHPVRGREAREMAGWLDSNLVKLEHRID